MNEKMRSFYVTVRHGAIGLGWDFERIFEVKAENIVEAQKRVLDRIKGITGLSLFYILQAEEIK